MLGLRHRRCVVGLTVTAPPVRVVLGEAWVEIRVRSAPLLAGSRMSRIVEDSPTCGVVEYPGRRIRWRARGRIVLRLGLMNARNSSVWRSGSQVQRICAACGDWACAVFALHRPDWTGPDRTGVPVDIAGKFATWQVAHASVRPLPPSTGITRASQPNFRHRGMGGEDVGLTRPPSAKWSCFFECVVFLASLSRPCAWRSGINAGDGRRTYPFCGGGLV